MKALSIRQPWAWAIFHGGKDVENRNWQTSFRGEVLIHASKTYDHNADEFIENLLKIKIPENLPLGGIVGKMEITSCVTWIDSPWFFGEYGFLIRNAVELPFAPCRGQLGFFNM